MQLTVCLTKPAMISYCYDMSSDRAITQRANGRRRIAFAIFRSYLSESQRVERQQAINKENLFHVLLKSTYIIVKQRSGVTALLHQHFVKALWRQTAVPITCPVILCPKDQDWVALYGNLVRHCCYYCYCCSNHILHCYCCYCCYCCVQIQRCCCYYYCYCSVRHSRSRSLPHLQSKWNDG